MPRLPHPGSDDGNWGTILNEYLLVSHSDVGALKPGSVTSASFAPGAVSAAALADGSVSEAKLDSTVRTKLNVTGSGGNVTSLLGQPNGIATLGGDGKVPASQLPAGTGGGTTTAPDASASTKGILQLSGDLGGSATAPSVMKLAGVSLTAGTPTSGQVLTAGSNNSASWMNPGSTGTAGGTIWTSTTTPANPKAGDLWIDTTSDQANVLTKAYVGGEWVIMLTTPKPTPTTPEPPTNVTATAGDGQASVAFTPSTGATSYTVTSSSGQTATGSSSPITVTGLTNGTAVSFTVTASNSAGTSAASAASNEVTPSGGGGTVSPTPTSPSAGSVTDTGLTLNWTAPVSPGGTVTGYNVYDGSGNKLNSTPITGTSYNVTGLTAGTSYTFTIKSIIDGTEQSGDGASVSATTTGGGTTSNEATNLTATAAQTSVALSWTAPANPSGNVDGYNVYQDGTKQNTALLTDTSYSATNLTAGTTYTFVVKTVVDGTESTGVSANATTQDGGGGGGTGGGSATNIPRKLVGAYHNQFFEPTLGTVEANAPEYNLNLVSSALGAGGGNVTFSPSHQDAATFKSEMQASQAKGDIWLISVFGNGNFNLRDSGQADQLVASINGIADEYGFDGVDLNLEGNSDRTTPDQWEWLPDAAADFCQKIKVSRGNNFIVSAAPRPWEDYQREFAVKAGANLDLFGYQFYDIAELANDDYLKTHMMERVTQSVDMGIPASKILLGARIDDVAGNHGTLQGYIDGWKNIQATYPDIRGVFIWDTLLDQGTGWQFAKGMGETILGITP